MKYHITFQYAIGVMFYNTAKNNYVKQKSVKRYFYK